MDVELSTPNDNDMQVKLNEKQVAYIYNVLLNAGAIDMVTGEANSENELAKQIVEAHLANLAKNR